MTRRAAIIAVVAAAVAAVALVLGVGALARWRAEIREAGPSLSLFEPHAGGCVWSRYYIAHDRAETIARFSADCQGARLAWRPDGRQALVWFAPEGAGPQDVMLYQVDIAAGKATRLPLPDIGEPERYLLDRSGRVIAFTLDAEDLHGSDALARALTLDVSGAWRVLETRARPWDDPGAAGVTALALYQQAQRDAAVWRLQSDVLLMEPEGYQAVRSEVLKAALRERLPPSDRARGADGPWLALTRAGWPRAVITRGVSGRTVIGTGLAMFARVERATAIPGLEFGPSDRIRLMSQGSLLLVTEWGTGSAPHLYDVRAGKRLFQSKLATAAVFWPHPRRAAD